MEPEDMDLVELVEEVAVEPTWRIASERVAPEAVPTTLRAGQRGMVVHRHSGDAVYDVEFIDDASREPVVLAVLRAEQVRVIERDTLAIE